MTKNLQSSITNIIIFKVCDNRDTKPCHGTLSGLLDTADRHNRGSCDDTADMTGLMHLSTRSQFLYVVVGEQPFTATQPTTPPA